MKSFLRIVFVFLVVSFPLFGKEEITASPHVVLYFDINKTLIASDKAGGKSVEDVLNELLSEKYEAVWDGSQDSPTSFRDYVHRILVPKTNANKNTRKQRQAYTQHFVDYLESQNHPLYETVLEDYEKAIATLTTSNGIIFPSFYALLTDLDQKGISYSVILRSYGEEIFEVRDEINAVHKDIFRHSGKFRSGELLIDGREVVRDAESIYNTLRRIEHTAIHDDWAYWDANNMSTANGKPFYIDEKDNETLCIFFDDNIKVNDSPKNIIAPLDAATGELIPVTKLVESGRAVRVDTLKAILETDYYINLVEDALQMH